MRDLSDLIDRVRVATGPDRELDCAIFCATAESPFQNYYPDCVMASQGGFAARVEISDIPKFTGSIDAAIELCERVLPNVRIKFDFDDSYARAEIWQGRGYAREKLLALHEDPNGEAPLALNLAVLLAKQEIDGHD